MDKWQKINKNYMISTSGDIKRIGREVNHCVRNKNGYLVTDLYEDGKRTTVRVHRAVAEAFIPNPENKPEVNHKDGNKMNNRVENLEWVTKSENALHAYKTGLMKPSSNIGRKGKPFRIVETGEVFSTLMECEKAINGNNRHISDCLHGKQKTHRGYHFEYI